MDDVLEARGDAAPDLPTANLSRDVRGAVSAARNDTDRSDPAINSSKIVKLKMPRGAAAIDLPAANDGRDAVAPDQDANNAEDGLGPARDFTKIVAINVQDKTFHVYKDILTTDPYRFDAKFNNPSLDRKGQSISIDDVSPDCVAEYVQALQQSFYVPDFKLRARHPARTFQDLYTLTKLLIFRGLACRFHDNRFLIIVREALNCHWNTMSVEEWCAFYSCQSDAEVRRRVLHLQEAYEVCKGRLLPYRFKICSACANCPPQVFAEVITGLELEAEFRTEVSKQFALRYADPELTKKRKAAENQSPETSAKRQSG